MSSNRKARGDAKLKTLDDDLQKAIFERCKGGKYKDAVTWLLAEFDVDTSVGALSDFFSWYALKQRLDLADSHVRALEDLVNESGLKVDPGAMRDVMGAAFLSEASRSGDFKTFRGAFELLIKAEKNSIERGKLEILQKKAAALDLVKDAVGKADPTASGADVQQTVMDLIDQAMGIKPASKP